MDKHKEKSTGVDFSEREIQDWLQQTISSGQLINLIAGQDQLENALQSSEAIDWWPSFPIDYLSRLRTLKSAKAVLAELNCLELVSTSTKSISRTKRESLFVDLLYAVPEGSRFIAIEIKKDRATARETATELLAYEHEILNHAPFASANDILMVVVSREFSPLLDHAIAGLITWGRKRILCLRVTGSADDRGLTIHLPKAWEAIGQKTLPATGIQIAQLCPYPHSNLTNEQIYDICETAVNLMAREAERAGASGFAMIVEDHFYPGLTSSPYSIIAGAVNPYSFLPEAQEEGLVAENTSALSKFLLSESRLEEMTQSWEWTTSDGGAAKKFLKLYGSPAWEGFSDWSTFRDIERWRSDVVTADRHLHPVRTEFWGVIGDYARDFVINGERMRSFIPGFCKPGIDWRHPHLGVMFLDDVSIPPVVSDGQWTFSSIFAFGMRLGRFAAIAATFADADEQTKCKLQSGLFWAEADIHAIMTEVRLRYLATNEIDEVPPVIRIGLYNSSTEVMAQVSEFSKWFIYHFIGSSWPLLQQSFQTGLEMHCLFDVQFSCNIEELDKLKQVAASIARNWLSETACELHDNRIFPHDRKKLLTMMADTFGTLLPIEQSIETAREAIAKLEDSILIDKLFVDIPAIVSCWHPQLAHTLATLSCANQDWIFYKEQIKASIARGVKHPCIVFSAGGQIGIGSLPGNFPVPRITDPEEEVLCVDNQTVAEITYVAKWEDIADGKIRNSRIQS